MVWALLIAYASVELGWLAWAIGAGVGAAAVFAGGRGTVVAASCEAIWTTRRGAPMSSVSSTPCPGPTRWSW